MLAEHGESHSTVRIRGELGVGLLAPSAKLSTATVSSTGSARRFGDQQSGRCLAEIMGITLKQRDDSLMREEQRHVGATQHLPGGSSGKPVKCGAMTICTSHQEVSADCLSLIDDLLTKLGRRSGDPTKRRDDAICAKQPDHIAGIFCALADHDNGDVIGLPEPWLRADRRPAARERVVPGNRDMDAQGFTRRAPMLRHQ